MQSSQNLISPDQDGSDRPSIKGEKTFPELMNLFHDQLRELLWSEKKLANLVPQLISRATNEALIEVLSDQLQETIEHIGRLATMFRLTKQKTAAVECNEMAMLIMEAEKISESRNTDINNDVEIMKVLKKIEHHLFTIYCELRELAEVLDLSDCEILILDSLSEKKATSLKLVKVATKQDP